MVTFALVAFAAVILFMILVVSIASLWIIAGTDTSDPRRDRPADYSRVNIFTAKLDQQETNVSRKGNYGS